MTRDQQIAELTFDQLIAITRGARRSIALWVITGLMVGVVIGAVRPRNYTARASFIAEQEKLPALPAGLNALAGRFGLGLTSDAGRSPQFYRSLVETSGLLRSIVDSVVEVYPGDSTSIRRLLHGDPDNSRRNIDGLLRKLRRRVSAEADPRTGVVNLLVSSRTPAAAENMAQLVLGAVKHFNVTTRQLRAREVRTFLENRVAQAHRTLRDSEDDLRSFYQRNRRIGDSPQLLFEEARMKRQIELRQELYTSLSRELESARIDEVNDTPTITVIDEPLADNRPSGPGMVTLAAIGALLGLFARAGWFLIARR
jgi:uncharacterized protein involved in exopolysaccharide biosynthesis